MKGSKEIMESMMEGEEYVNALMTMETYLRINEEIQEEIAITVRVKNDYYKTDETYRNMTKAAKKAKERVRNYEFKKNNK